LTGTPSLIIINEISYQEATMGDKYRTEYKSGGGIVPREEYVVNKETGEREGTILRWDHEKAGEVIEKEGIRKDK